MNEIEFRGKRYNGEWVFGDILRLRDFYCICNEKSLNGANILPFEVIPETIGRYSGEKDINGERIFEGDILIERIRTRATKDGAPGYRVRKYIVRCNTWTFYLEAIGAQGRPSRCVDKCEVIGNIHDNPELLTEGGT